MMRKTLQTLAAHPVIILLFAIPFILMLASNMPVIMNIDTMIDFLSDYLHIGQVKTESLESIMQTYSLSGLLSIASSLLIAFIILPIAFHKVYEACEGKDRHGWAKRGLKRNWWKIFTSAFILTFIFVGMWYVAFVIVQLPVLGFPVFTFLIYSVAAIYNIVMTATAVEKKYFKSFGTSFKTGMAYFFRQLGTSIIMSLPIIAICVLGFFMFSDSFVKYSNIANPNAMLPEMFASSMSIVWFFLGLSYLYSFFAFAYLYTYSMNKYLAIKEKNKPSEETFATGGAAFDSYLSPYEKFNRKEPDNGKTSTGTDTKSGNMEN